jgi:drug/metabolite transporter (DMT)-like permease
MYATICNHIAEIPFFSSAAFGIMAMVIVGASWCLIGLIMGDAPKRGIEPSLVQLFGGVVSVLASVVIMFATKAYPTAPARVVFWTCAAYAYSGMSNFIMLQIMSSAMQSGPNGIIWSIIQSAMIFPFIGGILFFGVEFTAFRGIGIFLVLAALVLFALAKDNSNNSGKWKLKAFICLAMCAIQQNITTMPSYFPEVKGVSSICRSLVSALAILVTALIYNIVRMNDARREQIKKNIRNLTLWKYIGGLQFFNLIFAYTLLYPGLDTMADHGLGGMCYPMLVGSCIVSFTISSVLILKEKIRPVQVAALTACIAGLVFICTKA